MSYGLAYVLIPASFASLQLELDHSLAPFRRGGRGDFPDEQLAFDDVTADLRRLHGATLTVELSERDGLAVRTATPNHLHLINLGAIGALLRGQGVQKWSGRLLELEPDFDRFAAGCCPYERHPITGGYGQWLNPLGRWDWWELGGRFDGVISGAAAREPRSSSHMISSGPSAGRALIDNVARALGGETSDVEAEVEANLEPVAGLLAAADRGADQAFPTALVLPQASCPNDCRWIDNISWHQIPTGARRLLDQGDDAGFAQLVHAAYRRFPDLAAAGVAYHW